MISSCHLVWNLRFNSTGLNLNQVFLEIALRSRSLWATFTNQIQVFYVITVGPYKAKWLVDLSLFNPYCSRAAPAVVIDVVGVCRVLTRPQFRAHVDEEFQYASAIVEMKFPRRVSSLLISDSHIYHLLFVECQMIEQTWPILRRIHVIYQRPFWNHSSERSISISRAKLPLLILFVE